MSLFEELKRRNVLKTALLYVVSSWLILQVADVLLPNLGAPDWAFRLVFGLLLLGFPIVLVFAWVFELTPDGVKRESAPGESETADTGQGRKINLLIVVLLLLAIAVVAADRLIPEKTESPVEPGAVVTETEQVSGDSGTEGKSTPADRTIVVLPFADMSPAQDQAYLSDGIAEELLNLLAKVPELRVVSRTSAFSFKGKGLTVAELASQLGVAHVLEGSVRKAGERVRISAQLIDAREDVNLWSDQWDRTLTDVFAIQDEIAGSVVAALQVELLGQVPKTEQTDLSAWSIYLQAQHEAARGTPDSMRQATELFREALAIDAEFVPAWIGLGVNFANLQSLRAVSPAEARGEIITAAERVLELDSGNADGYTLMAFASDYGEGDYAAAVRNYKRALEIDPNNIRARNGLAVVYRTLGDIERAIAMQERLLENDPLNPSILFNHGMTRVAVGDLEGADRMFEHALSISPELLLAHVWLGIVDLLQGDAQSCLEIFEQLYESTGSPLFTHIGRAMTLPALGDEDGGAAALAELEDGWGQSFAYVIATIHAWHSRADEAFHWLGSAIDNRGPAAVALIRSDPMLVSLHADARWQPLLEKAGLSDKQVAAILD